MKVKLNKKKMKNLSQNAQNLPQDMTPQVAGGYISKPGMFGCGSWMFCELPTEAKIEK